MRNILNRNDEMAGTHLNETVGSNNRRAAVKKALCLLLVLLACTAVFASDSIAVLDTAGDKILALISAKWVKAILVLALIVEFGAIAFGKAQGQEGVIGKLLPWVIGTAGILGATSVVNYFFKGITQEALAMAVDVSAAIASV